MFGEGHTMTTANERRLVEANKRQKQQIDTQERTIDAKNKIIEQQKRAIRRLEGDLQAHTAKTTTKATQAAKFKR